MQKIHKAGALIFKDKKILIVKPHGKDFYINPGGKYEENETPIDCLKREMNEELNVDTISYKHYKTYEVKKAAHSGLPLSLELYILEIDGELKPSNEIEKFDWLGKEEYENKTFNTAPSFDQFIPDLINDGYL